MLFSIVRDAYTRNMLSNWEKKDNAILSKQSLPEHITEICNVPYIDDGHKGHLLDIYYPENQTGLMPAIIDIHGGGFFYGYKEQNKLFDFHLAKSGCIIFNLNYRLAFNEAKVPDQLADIISAFNWIDAHADSYSVDKNKIYVIGESAGAYLAVMAFLIAKNLQLQTIFNIDKSDLPIKAMGLVSSFMEWPTRKEFQYAGMRSMILEKGYKKQAYFKNLILKNLPEVKNLPPLFIISNEDDALDDMTYYFVDILKETNVKHTFHHLKKNNYKKLGHVFNIFHLDWQESTDVNNAMLEFLLQY